MKMNMNEWLLSYRNSPIKKTMPVLSFPGMQLIGANVDQLVHSGELQAKCMKAIADRYDAAAAVSLMDLSVESEAFGSSVRFTDEEPPAVTNCIVETMENAQALAVPKVGTARTGECLRGMELVSQMITDRPIFAGVIGPFSLIGRLMDMQKVMINCRREPALLHVLLEKATDFITDYILALKEAGANGVVIAEPAAGLLAPKFNKEFSIPYVERIREKCEDESFLVIYHNCGNTIPLLADIVEMTNFRVIHLGNAIDIEDALKIIPEQILVMGNIDPANVFCIGTPEIVKEATLELLERCSKYDHFAISSGCDIPPTTPLENIDAYFQAVTQFYQE
jgi:uroporphyrinogen decarboxylase